MKRAVRALGAAWVAALLLAAPASADFGLNGLDFSITDAGGAPSMQAGSHPFAVNTELKANTEVDPELGKIPAGQVRDLTGELPPGLTGSPFATPRCSGVDFATLLSTAPPLPRCSDSSVVGLTTVKVALPNGVLVTTAAPVYNLAPPPGTVLKLGFVALASAPVTIEFAVKDTPPYNVTYAATNITQMVRFFEAKLTVWGNPSDPAHDEDRGVCGAFFQEGFVKADPGGKCPTSNPNLPFLVLPRSCTGPLSAIFRATSWLGESFEGSAVTHEGAEPIGVGGCSKLAFAPRIAARPTTDRAESPSGLDFNLDIDDVGLTSPNGLAHSDLQKAVVALPEGVTANPSQAEGLEVCSEADFAREKAGSQFGEGCPAASKIGTVEAETPLLEGKVLKGSLFIAEPYANRFGSLLAIYMTLKEPALGLGIKLAGKVEPDPRTGQLIATFEDLPQQPFSHFRLHFREGGRSPLITPPGCGSFTTTATFTPWANPTAPLTTTSSFEIAKGVDGGSCPPAGTPPFEPGFTAGSLSNAAGSFSPFYMRLTRRDGDQDLTRFDATLPLGVLGKLAGVEKCPDSQIALAKAKSGKAELASPSCPPGSRIGRVLAGAGVGSQLTYVPGTIHLAGPFGGAPLSVVAIVPAVAGPFDVGTVVTRQALRLDPRTGEVLVDGASSDPIPHILAGIPLKVRDIRVYADRPGFTLNPTSCDPLATTAQLWGGGSDLFSRADDAPVARSARFQAAGCAGLGFKPRLSLQLKGGAKRGEHPALRAVLRPRPGDANVSGAVVRLPRSAFLDQAHIRTICTRVQFAADSCPPGAVYGHVRAFSPLLEEPLEGPVYLRSSDHNLPDLVFDLHGLVDFEAVGRIDSKRGGIRATFAQVPDAPISKVLLSMQGGRKGLIVNSTDLCRAPHRVSALFSAHNGKRRTLRPQLRASCPKGRPGGNPARPPLSN
jgi:hypothetical protein